MSATIRKFGTDVSNIPKKDLSAKKAFKKSIPKTGQESVKNVFVQKSQPKELLIEEPLDDEIFIKSSPISLKSQSVTEFPFRYERDFLLSFQEFFAEPLEGLIPEVLPGYVNPELDVSKELASLNIHPLSRSAPSLKLKKLSTSNDESLLASPYGGVVFKAFKAQDSAGSPGRLSVVIPPVSSDEIAPVPIALDFNTPTAVRSQSLPSSPTSDLQPTVLSLEWRVKKVSKKSKPKESDPRRLAARQKQIDIGMNTPGYVRFTESVPADQRTKDHPRVPDITQVCSKRSWDGQVRKWRRMLHDYDPEEAGKSRTLDDDDDKENDSQSDKEDFSDEEEIHGIEAQISA